MRLILRSDKGKAGVLCRACLDLPSAACPKFHGVRQVYARMQGALTLPDATYFSSADRSAVLDEYGIRIQELCMLARMHIEATMARLSRSDARQSPQLPTCVDRPMAWVLKGCYRRRRVPWVPKAGSCTFQPLGAEHGACAAVCGRHDAAGLDGLHRWQQRHVPRMVQNELSS
jgi:hypothetical protein